MFIVVEIFLYVVLFVKLAESASLTKFKWVSDEWEHIGGRSSYREMVSSLLHYLFIYSIPFIVTGVFYTDHSHSL